jgi:hypothetical protein
MMGYVVATSPCIGCGKLFAYNPHKVPSCSAVTGRREPICEDCVHRVNPMRKANGLEEIVILPGAYDAIDEDEL